MKFFRLVFFPAVITASLYALIAYASYRHNRDYDVNQIGDLSMNNNVFPHSSLPYTSSSGR